MGRLISGTTTYYVRDNGGRLVGERIGANSYYYLFDGLGSVVALTDGSGTVVDTYSYDPYGKVTPGASNSVANLWQYTGGYHDDATGLVKLGQRYYDSNIGRWTQLDPLGGGYVYASNNPINFVDPRGLDDLFPFFQGPDFRYPGGFNQFLTDSRTGLFNLGIASGTAGQVARAQSDQAARDNNLPLANGYNLAAGFANNTATVALGTSAAIGAVQTVGTLFDR